MGVYLRLRRIGRKIVSIGLAVILVATSSFIPTTVVPKVEAAQSDNGTVIVGNMEVDGSGPYHMVTLDIGGFISMSWKAYIVSVTNNTITQASLTDVYLDTSIYDEFFTECSGASQCAYLCNNCLRNYIRNCKITWTAVGVGGLATTGLTCAGLIIGLSLTVIGGLLVGAGCLVVAYSTVIASRSQYNLCKAGASSACSASTGCSCTSSG